MKENNNNYYNHGNFYPEIWVGILLFCQEDVYEGYL